MLTSQTDMLTYKSYNYKLFIRGHNTYFFMYASASLLASMHLNTTYIFNYLQYDYLLPQYIQTQIC